MGWNSRGNMVTEKTPNWAKGSGTYGNNINGAQAEEMVNNYFCE